MWFNQIRKQELLVGSLINRILLVWLIIYWRERYGEDYYCILGLTRFLNETTKKPFHWHTNQYIITWKIITKHCLYNVIIKYHEIVNELTIWLGYQFKSWHSFSNIVYLPPSLMTYLHKVFMLGRTNKMF